MRRMKRRILAMLLAIAMLAGMLPAALAAEEAESTLTAQEIPGLSRLDGEDTAGQERETCHYDPDELVTVIVELEADPVLTGFRQETESGLTVGEALAEFLTTGDAVSQSSALRSQQDDLAAQLRSATGSSAVITDRWTVLLNGFAVRIPYGQLETVQSMAGVKRAYVEHTYERPDESLLAQAASRLQL